MLLDENELMAAELRRKKKQLTSIETDLAESQRDLGKLKCKLNLEEAEKKRLSEDIDVLKEELVNLATRLCEAQEVLANAKCHTSK